MSSGKSPPAQGGTDGRVRGSFIRLTLLDDEGRREKWITASHVMTVEASRHRRAGVRSAVMCWPFRSWDVLESEDEILALLERATKVRIDGIELMAVSNLFHGVGGTILQRCVPLNARSRRTAPTDLPLSGDKEDA